MKKSPLLLLFTLLSVSSAAGLGPEIPLSQTPHNLCFLDFSGPEAHSFNGVCSGVLINSSTILTAAHCIQKEMPKTIRCGLNLEKVDFLSESQVIHPKYERVGVANDIALPLHDVAYIRLKNPVAMSPLEQLSFESAKDTIIEPQQEKSYCGFFGFSQFMGKPKNAVETESRGWTVDLKIISRLENYKVLQMDGLMAPGGLLQVGDSGGPLMCYVKGIWKLLGINSSRDFLTRSNFMAIADMDFVTEAQMSAPVLSLSKKEQFKSQRPLLMADFVQIKKKIERLKLDESLFTEELAAIENLFYKSNKIPNINSSLRKLETKVIHLLLTRENFALRLKPYSIIDVPSLPLKKSIGDLNFNYFQIQRVNLNEGTALGRLRTFGPSNYFTCLGELLCQSEIVDDVTVSISAFDISGAEASRVFK